MVMNPRIAELLTTEALDMSAIRGRLWEWAKLPDDEAQAELAEARGKVRFTPGMALITWRYLQAVIALMGSLLAMRPELRFVIAEVHDELGL